MSYFTNLGPDPKWSWVTCKWLLNKILFAQLKTVDEWVCFRQPFVLWKFPVLKLRGTWLSCTLKEDVQGLQFSLFSYICACVCACRFYLCIESFALCCGCVGIGRNGGACVDVICVDVVTDAAAHRAAVIPATHNIHGTEETERLTLVHLRQYLFQTREDGRVHLSLIKQLLLGDMFHAYLQRQTLNSLITVSKVLRHTRKTDCQLDCRKENGFQSCGEIWILTNDLSIPFYHSKPSCLLLHIVCLNSFANAKSVNTSVELCYRYMCAFIWEEKRKS